ncbi:SCP2 sterol-binding domain-containing protein [Blastochloris viridis]|uniref:Putative sterol carrier protein n=1 Tax=Blastochloris viridis TaxID=1079 RepID=A0A0H5BGA3_BLAVI|nr:SCP2 sterol-binding domain-containing protein [Blastochloris viridis]ALK09930.1 SCP-2 sterol transfer family protein [Blastochloris viridis]BAS00160.1 sterol carrier family protein [Blastochloris viridis]CUU42593.1 Putative sterol carrier protein [Blastochloris viridis]
MSDAEDRLREALPRLGRLGAVVRFDLGSDGMWVVDARSSAPVLAQVDGDDDAACTIKISADNLIRLMDGSLDPMLGYTLGKIKVSGSKGVAMKLVSAIA